MTARIHYHILFPVAILSALGVILVYSASFYIARTQSTLGQYYYLVQHIVRVLLGVGAFCFAVFVPLDFVRKHSWKLLMLAVILLFCVMVFGHLTHGARRAFRITPYLFFQPSDLAKLSLVLFLAAFISGRKGGIRRFRGVYLPSLGVLLLVTVAVAIQPDLSTGLLILGIGIGMLFFAGARFSHLLLTLILGAGIFFSAHKTFPHVQKRVESFGDSEEHYQLTQAKIGISNGRLFGVGPGRGKEKLRYLPLPHTDFIFATIGEEFGFLGTLVVISLFMFLGFSGFRVAQLHLDDPYKSLLAFGFSFMIVLYSLVHISVALGVLPTTGQPLPFISYGGSAMICNMAGAGILFRLAGDANRDIHKKHAWRRSLS
jgi:cell division protein FtsW